MKCDFIVPGKSDFKLFAIFSTSLDPIITSPKTIDSLNLAPLPVSFGEWWKTPASDAKVYSYDYEMK